MKLAVNQGAGAGAGGNASGGGGGGGAGAGSGAAIVATLQNDPVALKALLDTLAGGLLGSDFAAKMVAMAESVMAGRQPVAPGQRIAGTVSTLSGAIQGGSGSIMTAMVFLNGAATAVPCYVSSHLQPDLATGQEVWVEPVNGAMDDLMVVAIRNYTATPVASQALTAAQTAQTAANTNNVHWLNPSQQVLNAASKAPGSTTAFNFWGSSGVPSGATAVYLFAFFTSATVGAYVSAQPGTTGSGVSAYFAVGNLAVASGYVNGSGWCPLDGTGNCALYIGGGGTNNATVTVYVLGYSQ